MNIVEVTNYSQQITTFVGSKMDRICLKDYRKDWIGRLKY